MKNTDKTKPNHILIGLGGTGGKVLKAFRKRLWEEFPKFEDRRKLPIGFVYVDSTDEMMKPGDPTWKVFGQSAQFEESEFVNIKTIDLGKILDNPEVFPGLANVVKNGEMMRKTLGEVGVAAGQKRRAGRILFASNISKYMAAVKSQYEKVTTLTSGSKSYCHIHIFTGLAGGTGSGSIIDAVTQLRADASFKGTNTEITVYAMVPELEIPAGCQAGRYHQNGYAALCELSALNIGNYLPCDVIKGTEHTNLNTDLNRQFGLVVYSNVNENGASVESFTELPKLLADTVYYSVFMKLKDGVTDDFQRGLSCENINDYCVEYSTVSKGNDKERARTKAVSSFGIKRIVYPEARIVEHISYTLADSVFNQMAYNNFKEDFGFTGEPQKKDYNQLYIKDGNQMIKWKLDDTFFMLNERILDTDRKFEKIDEYWRNQSVFYSYDNAKIADSDPLHFIEKFMLEKYKKDFRLKQGVEEYYQDKSKDLILGTQVEYIVESIEKDLYTQWYEGHLSLMDLLRVSDEILVFIKERRNKLPGNIKDIDEKIEGFANELKGNHAFYNNLRTIQKLAGRTKNCFADHQAILADLYTEKTRSVAMDFASRLLGKLQVKFEEFHDQVQSFVGVLGKCMDEAAKRISDRNQKQGTIKDMKQSVIEVREDAKVSAFEKSLLLNRNIMETLSGALRHELVGNQTFAHFGDLTKNVSVEKAFDVVDSVLGQRVRDIHEVECTKDKLIGINILQQLQKVLVTDDEIRAFAKDAVDKSGVFILLDDTQLQKSLNNNDNPVSKPETMNRKTILVTMPAYDGDDALKGFAEKLENAFQSAFGNNTPSSTINFDTSDDVKNEITIAAVKYCFPLRALKWLPEYESEYKAMTENPNPIEAKEARIILHSEGDGSCLPPIMGEKVLTAQEFIPYFFIAAAMGILNEADDDINGHGWCMTMEDEWGSPVNTYLAIQFIDLPISESIDATTRKRIQELVDDVLGNPDLPIVKRNEFVEKIKTLMRDVVGRECSSTNSPKYQQFSAQAKKALEMIKK